MAKPSIKDWIYYSPNVGVEALHMIGYPGTGKSNMATGLFQKCLQNNELLVMPGDRFCEWKHFPYHPKFPTQMTVLVPDNVDLIYYPDKETVQRAGAFHKVDYTKLNVWDYLSVEKRLLVVYDQHLKLADRASLWSIILEQLINRPVFVNVAVGLLFHEAGILFPQNAIGQQWRATDKFSELFVETRKALVRVILVSQIETEIESTIRGKCLYACIRKAFLSKAWPKLVRKVTPFTPLNEYQLVLGKGLYSLDNKVSKYYEKKVIMKIIPTALIDIGLSSSTTGKKFTQDKIFCFKCGHTWKPRVRYPSNCPRCSVRSSYGVIME